MRWPHHAPQGRIAYVNGRYLPHADASVHIEDRGLQFGDSIYEVVAVVGGALHDEAEHLDRLERSLREIRVAMPVSRAALKLIFRQVARRNKLRDGLIYLQITRGAFRRDHPIPATPAKPTLIITARRTDLAAAAQKMANGVSVVTTADERWARCDIKTTQLLANLLAKTDARKQGAYEAWLVDRDGFITEGSSANAWIVTGQGELITRALSHAVLPGVTRRVILEAAAVHQLKVVERSFTPAEARCAREAFISSATGAALPVVRIDGAEIGDGTPGPVTRQVRQIYEDWATAHTEKAAIRP